MDEFAIEAVLERPPVLAVGAEWTIKMHPPGLPSWQSISRVEELDRHRCRFAHQTRNADGNPSYVKCAWEVVGAGTGAEVTVTWDCYLKTLDAESWAGSRRSAARDLTATPALRVDGVVAVNCGSPVHVLASAEVPRAFASSLPHVPVSARTASSHAQIGALSRP